MLFQHGIITYACIKYKWLESTTRAFYLCLTQTMGYGRQRVQGTIGICILKVIRNARYFKFYCHQSFIHGSDIEYKKPLVSVRIPSVS